MGRMPVLPEPLRYRSSVGPEPGLPIRFSMPVKMTCRRVRILLRTRPVVDGEAAISDASGWLLSDTERERASRFVFGRDRATYSAAHSLLRSMLTEFHQCPPLAWQFRNNPHGRPELDPAIYGSQAPRFNLSHTHGRVAVAITLDPVPDGFELGVDAESVARTADVLGLARRFLSPAEADWLQALPASDHQSQFLRLWTLKEAVAKAVGLGLSLNFQSFHCRVDPLSVSFDQPGFGPSECWNLHNEWVAPGHWLSLAVRCPSGIRPDWQIEHLNP